MTERNYTKPELRNRIKSQVMASGDVVDLPDSALVVQDEFGIQEPQIDFAIRTT
jgi:hypothetical protein